MLILKAEKHGAHDCEIEADQNMKTCQQQMLPNIPAEKVICANLEAIIDDKSSCEQLELRNPAHQPLNQGYNTISSYLSERIEAQHDL